MSFQSMKEKHIVCEKIKLGETQRLTWKQIKTSEFNLCTMKFIRKRLKKCNSSYFANVLFVYDRDFCYGYLTAGMPCSRQQLIYPNCPELIVVGKLSYFSSQL